jgi:hypothetical protein
MTRLLRKLMQLPQVLWHKQNIAIYKHGIAEEEKRVAEAPDRLRIWRQQLAEEQAALAILQQGASSRVRYERDRGSCTINASAKVNESVRAALDQGAAHGQVRKLLRG